MVVAAAGAAQRPRLPPPSEAAADEAEDQDIVRKLSFSSANSSLRLSALSCDLPPAPVPVPSSAPVPAPIDAEVDQADRVQVVVRLRPVNAATQSQSQQQQQQQHGECFQVVSPYQLLVKAPTCSLAYRTTGTASSFRFSHVFGPDTSQFELFEHTTCRVLSRALNRAENGLVFAYGVTNSGKTHTITGDLSNPHHQGILPRAIRFLLDQQQQQQQLTSASSSSSSSSSSSAFSLQLSYVEVYNEKVYDLLAEYPTSQMVLTRPVLKLQEQNGKVFIKQLTMQPIDNQQQALAWLQLGQQNKQMAETKCNQVSSRSHCVFTIYIYDQLRQRLRSKVSIVDLAGSERASKSGANGLRLQESSNINKSLMNLMHCLENLRWNQQHAHTTLPRRMVPFRQSQLTRLFQESLVGNAMENNGHKPPANVVMIVAIEPCARNFDETLRTLQFSAIAKELIPMNPHMMTRRSQQAQSQQLQRRINSQIAANYDLNGRVKRSRVSGANSQQPGRAPPRRAGLVHVKHERRSRSSHAHAHTQSQSQSHEPATEPEAQPQILGPHSDKSTGRRVQEDDSPHVVALQQQLQALQHQVESLQQANHQLTQDNQELTHAKRLLRDQQIELIREQNATAKQEKLELEIRIRQEVVAEMTLQTTQVRNQCTRKLELQQTQFDQDLQCHQINAQMEFDRLRSQLRECEEEMQRRQQAFEKELAALRHQVAVARAANDEESAVQSRKRSRSASKLPDEHASPQKEPDQINPATADQMDHNEKENHVRQPSSQHVNQSQVLGVDGSSHLRRSSRRLAML